uniref:Uncharacterized protein n=1 Tax=Eptatretus burgeri TaxID=7764 RepID=A0A8C4QIS8_EPTBU
MYTLHFEPWSKIEFFSIGWHLQYNPLSWINPLQACIPSPCTSIAHLGKHSATE